MKEKKLMTLNRLCNEISLNSLFTNKGTYKASEAKELLNSIKIKLDGGKYSPSIKNKTYSELENNTAKVFWYETRKDKDGPYVQLITIQESLLSETTYNNILSILKLN